jgi:flagella basal body P-ring formation protein FlgA
MVKRFKVQGSRFKVQGSRCKVQGSGCKVHESEKAMGYGLWATNNIRVVCTLVCVIYLLPFTFYLLPSVACAAEYSANEARIIRFIKEIYNDSDDIQVHLNTIPNQLKEKIKVKNITFMKVPDTNGDGICTIEIDVGGSRSKNVQVPFRVFVKRKLFVLKTAMKKDESIRRGDIFIKETYMNGKGDEYPASVEDLTDKILKRDVPANTILTYQMLEEPIAVQRGEIVNIVAENKKLLVLVKGKTIDRGRIGDTVRVKNVSSGKEIVGRVTAHNTVGIDF